jgi:hypothetical protein
MLPLFQALVAVLGQHLSYGSWMNANYFVFAAVVLVFADKLTEAGPGRKEQTSA